MKNELTAQRLSIALNRKGINQQQLADMSGVSKHSISQYIHGTHVPSNISAAKMGAVLEVNPMWLMGYDVPMTSGSEGSGSSNDNDDPIVDKIIKAYLAADPVTQEHVRLLLRIGGES